MRNRGPGRQCQECGANLDPAEICDCIRKSDPPESKPPFTESEQSGNRHFAPTELYHEPGQTVNNKTQPETNPE